jgi:hypothetical protein
VRRLAAKYLVLMLVSSIATPGALATSGEDSVEWILQHDAIIEGMIVDRTYIEPRRSLLDWAIVNDQPNGARHRAEEPFRGCRLGVRVTDVLMGETPDIIEIDLWWVPQNECLSGSGYSGEGLDIGSNHLFLIYQIDLNRWVPDSLMVPYDDPRMNEWVREVLRQASGDRTRRAIPQPALAGSPGQPPYVRQHFSPADTPCRPPSADHKQVDAYANWTAPHNAPSFQNR